MGTYLDDTAEALAPAPARTNFFDPVPGQNVISRYGNARALAEDVGAAAELESQLNRAQFDRARLASLPRDDAYEAARQEREKLLWDREDQEFAAKKEAEAAAMDFLANFDETVDPNAEGAVDKITEVIAGLPAGMMDDPRVATMLKVKLGRAEKAEAARQKAASDNLRFTRDLEKYNMRLRDAKLTTGLLTKEEAEQFRDPETGAFDYQGASILTLQKERAYKEEQAGKKEATVEEKLRAKVSNERAAAGVKNTKAFPSKVSLLLKKLGGKSASSTAKRSAEYIEAEAWDEDPLANWENRARELADSMGTEAGEEAFVEEVPGLDEYHKKLRRNLYRKATSETGLVDETPPTEGTEPPADAETPPAEAAPKAAPYGNRVRQNGKILKWNGTEYVPE